MNAARRALVLLALSGLGCHRGPGPSGGGEVVRLGVANLRISLPVFVALERQLFAKRGLAVETRRFDTAQPMADELAAGRLDAGGYVAFPILFDREGTPPPLRVTTAIVEDRDHRLSYLLVKKGSGIGDVRALRGRRLGILPTVAYRRWIEGILRHDGVDPRQVTITALAPTMQADVLAGGGVDALFTGDPMATAALARGLAELLTATPDVPRVHGEPFLFGTFAVAESLVRQRPAVATALRQGLDEAIALLAADPALGRQAMRPYLRPGELPFVDRYPAARYLSSAEVGGAQLDRVLAGAGRPSAEALVP